MIPYKIVWGKELVQIKKIRQHAYPLLNQPLFTPEIIDKLSAPEEQEGYMHIVTQKNEDAIGCVTLHIPHDPMQMHSAKFFSLPISPESKTGEILKLFVKNPADNFIAGYQLIFGAYEELRQQNVDQIFINFGNDKKDFYLKFGNIVGVTDWNGLQIYFMKVDIDMVEKKFAGLFRRFRSQAISSVRINVLSE